MKSLKTNFVLPVLCLCILACNKNSVLEPENQFVQIYFKYDFKNKLNTFDNTYQKDLVLDGVEKVTFWLTAQEQNSVLEQAETIDFFSFPDKFTYVPQDDSLSVYISPNPGEQILRIKYGGKDKTVIWTYPLNENDPQVEDLMKLKDFIISVIESKPEYKKLPPHRGGYV